jgi:hypothetical protein
MNKTVSALITLLLFPAFTAAAAQIEGTVQRLDKAKQEMVLNTESGSETVEISKATKGADKVKVGDSVKVAYVKKGDKLVAVTIAQSKVGSPVLPSDLPSASRGKPGNPDRQQIIGARNPYQTVGKIPPNF